MNEMIINLFTTIAVAIIYGQVEKHIYNSGYVDTSEHLGNTFSYYYHLPMLVVLLLIMWRLNILWFTPAFMLIEDISFFTKNKKKKLDETSWINFKMGGVRVLNQWIPFTYFVLLIASAILYSV